MIEFQEMRRDDGFRIEDRGEKVQDGQDNAPQELDVPEEHHHGGEDQADADTENDQEDHDQGKQQ